MRIEHVLQELSRQMALDGVALDENRVCQLVFDDKIVVNIESPLDNEDKVYLYSTVGIVPPENKEAFYEKLLEANLFGYGTGGATLAVSSELAEVILIQTFFMEKTDYQDFVNGLENFIDQTAAWLDQLAVITRIQPIQMAMDNSFSFQSNMLFIRP